MAKSRKRQDGEASTPEAPERNYGDRVAMRAYELYLARGASDGRDFDDWLTAERELARPGDDDRQD